MESRLVGYVRKDNNSLKISISKTAFNQCKEVESKNGEKYVGMIINLNRLRQLLEGDKEVTSITTPEE